MGVNGSLKIDMNKTLTIAQYMAECHQQKNARLYAIQSGDEFVVQDPSPVTIGDKYMDWPTKIVEVIYEPKKWWQFWKKKKQLGYIVLWVGNEED